MLGVLKSNESFRSLKETSEKERDDRENCLKAAAERLVAEARVLCVKEGKCEFEDEAEGKDDEYTKNSDISDYPSDIDSSHEN